MTALSTLQRTRPQPRHWRTESSVGTGLLLTSPAILLVLALVAYPLISLTIDVLQPAGLAALGEVLSGGTSQRALLRTIWVSVEVTVLALVLGSLVAWALCTAKRQTWRLILWLAVLAPFWMSVVVKNYAFVLLLRQGGPLNEVLVAAGIMSDQASLLYSETAVVVGMLYAMLPYAVLPLFATFSGIDRSLISAAETLGASRSRALVNVVLPLASRGMLSAATLVFVICLGFYVTPVVLGGPGTPFVASLIGSSIFEYFDMNAAKAFALVILCVALLSVILSQALTRFLPRGENK